MLGKALLIDVGRPNEPQERLRRRKENAGRAATISYRRSIGLYNACHDRNGSCKRNAPSGEFCWTREGEVLEILWRVAPARQVPARQNSSGAFMFTRNSSVEPQTLEQRTTRPTGGTGVERSITAPSSGEKSVIGNDLKIIGQGLKIISRGMLQVDGEIEGDVQAAEVIVGEKGKVTGMVAGRQIVVRGTVSGVICGQTVALQASSQVDGDIHHMSFAIEQGAHFEGRSRRAKSAEDLLAVVEGRGSGQPTGA